jgi:hypothetical protein
MFRWDEIPMSPGRRHLEFRDGAGHVVGRRQFDLEAGEIHYVRVSSDPGAPPSAATPPVMAPKTDTTTSTPKRGSLSVQSAENGLVVDINGTTIGLTPIREYELPLGSYKVRVTNSHTNQSKTQDIVIKLNTISVAAF